MQYSNMCWSLHMGKDFWLWCQKTETPETPGSIACIIYTMLYSQSALHNGKVCSDPCPTFRQASWIEVTISIALDESRIWHAYPVGISRDQIKRRKSLQSMLPNICLDRGGSAGNTSCKGASLAKYREARGCCHLGLLHRWPEVKKSNCTIDVHGSRQDAETGVPLSSMTKTLTHRVPSNTTVAKQTILERNEARIPFFFMLLIQCFTPACSFMKLDYLTNIYMQTCLSCSSAVLIFTI